MSKILVSGLVNIEITCNIDEFPIEYAPINYNFFGINTAVSGVGYNIACALGELEDEVDVVTLTGKDAAGDLVREELNKIKGTNLASCELSQTPQSVVLYDKNGRRRIYCDLKDIQDKNYDFSNVVLSDYNLVAACNINYSRPLLQMAKKTGITIATDVHVIDNVNDEYNTDFMKYSDILFMSNENILGNEKAFMKEIFEKYNNKIIVTGCGSKGAIMYVREDDRFYEMPAAKPERIVNTVGAGDCLFSTFISMYSKGMQPEKCLELAQKAAAHKIGFDGAAKGFITLKELNKSN